MKLPAIRVLPLTIAAAALLLTVQASSLWNTVSPDFASPAHAQEKSEASEDKPAGKAANQKDPAGNEVPDEVDKRDLLADFTPEEISVLYELAQRRELLDRRESELVGRVALIDAAEKRMEERVRELQKLRTSIEALVRQFDEQESKELESVVKIYETMKPKDAAAILEKLEMTVLLSIVDAMKERRTSAILAAMSPERAREVTAEMARKKTIDLSRMNASGNPG